MWEWYSGSSALSAHLKEEEVSHLPPIDYRYGWNLSKLDHQKKLIDTQITVGVDTIFAAPNCSPWGNNSRATPEPLRSERRELEQPTLLFLAVACFLQILLSRKYIVESCAYSDIFEHSPLRFLRQVPPMCLWGKA